MKKLFTILLLFTTLISFSQREAPFTLDDKERIIKIEERLNSTNERINSTNERITSLEKQMNEKFKSTNERISSLEKQMNVKFESIEDKVNTLFILILFVLGALVLMFGFILWDRRSVLRPVREEMDKVADNNTRIINALKEQAKTNPGLAEILKNTGIY